MLGIDSGGSSDEAIGHLADRRTDDVLHDVASLVHSLIARSSVIDDTRERSRLVLEKCPQLLTRQILRVSAIEDRLGLVAADWPRSESSCANDSAGERQEAVQILLGVCLAARRVAMKKWPRDTASDRRQSYTRAADLLCTAMERVS